VIYFNVDINIWRTADILMVCLACDFSQTFIWWVLSVLPFLLLEVFTSLYLFSISTVLKAYGQHLKAPAAMVRLRLYETLSLLPSHAFEGNFYEHCYKIELIFSCSVITTAVTILPFIILVAWTKIHLGIQWSIVNQSSLGQTIQTLREEFKLQNFMS
jgi:hypothetical protein